MCKGCYTVRVISNAQLLARALVIPDGGAYAFGTNLGFGPSVVRPPGGWNGGTGIGYSVLRPLAQTLFNINSDTASLLVSSILPGPVSDPDTLIPGFGSVTGFEDAQGQGFIVATYNLVAGRLLLADMPYIITIWRGPALAGQSAFR